MPDLAPYLLLLATVLVITMTNDVIAESDMMTLEEYHDFMTKQALKNKNARPKKVWTVSEKSLYDDLGDAKSVVERRRGDAKFEDEDVERRKGDEENVRERKGDETVLKEERQKTTLLTELKRFHRDGETFNKQRYRRSLKTKTDDETENDSNSDKSRHLGVQNRKYLPESGQIQVVSSAIRVLPNEDRGGQKRTARIMNLGVERMENGTEGEGEGKGKGKVEDDGHRQKRNEYHWRRPKTQFVTGTYRMTPPSSRFQLPAFPPQARNNRRYLSDNEVAPAAYRRSGATSQRRIIYYATLPEIVRPPATNQWQRHQSLSGLTAHAPPNSPLPHPIHTSPLHQHSTRQAAVNFDPNRPTYPNLNSNPNPPPNDNEIIHVSSAVIDVTNNRDQPSLPSQQPPATAILASSAITSIHNNQNRYDITSTNQNRGQRNTIYDVTSTNSQQNGGGNRNTIYDVTSTQNGGSKYTIYDMEPPYMRQPYYNNYYNLDNKLSGYDKQRYSYYYQNYQPLGGQYPPPVYHQNRFYEDVRTPPYRVHTPYHSDLPPYPHAPPPYQNSVVPYQNPPPYYNRKPEYVPIEIQTTAPSVSSTVASSTTSTTEATKGVGDPRHQTSSTAETGGELKQGDKGNSTNGLLSRYV